MRAHAVTGLDLVGIGDGLSSELAGARDEADHLGPQEMAPGGVPARVRNRFELSLPTGITVGLRVAERLARVDGRRAMPAPR